MKILVLNSGSSSIKFKVFNDETVVSEGVIDGIGLESCKVVVNDEKSARTVKTHDDAIHIIFEYLDKDQHVVDAVGHRVVHGGEKYSSPVIIDDDVIARIDKLSMLAPLHNPPNLAGILACKNKFPEMKQVAVFDTAFHQTMPKVAYTYAIPYEYYSKYKVRKYGFHGTSHKYISRKANEILGKDANLITCHIGNGSSVAAIKEGKSIDTTMGFTPLPGLMMGTRCGDIDPSIITYLMKKEDKTIDEVYSILNKKSGLLGISGSSDMRDIWAKVQENDEQSILALDMLAYSVANNVSSYFSLIGDVDAVIFTAGLGERAYYLREKVCERLKIFGIDLDLDKNKENAEEITTANSKVKVMVLPTDEELMIARDTKHLLE